MLCRGSSTEKSSFRLTVGCEVARTGVALERLAGEDRGPSEDRGPRDRRGEELSAVFIGDRALGGGSLRRAARTSVGSGIVPANSSDFLIETQSNSGCWRETYSPQYPYSHLLQ